MFGVESTQTRETTTEPHEGRAVLKRGKPSAGKNKVQSGQPASPTELTKGYDGRTLLLDGKKVHSRRVRRLRQC